MSKTSAVILTAFITVICTSLLWMGVGVVAYKAWMSTDEWIGEDLFSVELEAPAMVKVGELVTMQVTATNISEDLQTLNSIDIYDSLLDGFELVRVSPKTNDDTNIFDFRSFYFDDLRLKPGESTTVTFELKAVKPGTWQGDVDCCTPMESFSTAIATIMVADGVTQ